MPKKFAAPAFPAAPTKASSPAFVSAHSSIKVGKHVAAAETGADVKPSPADNRGRGLFVGVLDAAEVGRKGGGGDEGQGQCDGRRRNFQLHFANSTESNRTQLLWGNSTWGQKEVNAGKPQVERLGKRVLCYSHALGRRGFFGVPLSVSLPIRNNVSFYLDTHSIAPE